MHFVCELLIFPICGTSALVTCRIVQLDYLLSLLGVFLAQALSVTRSRFLSPSFSCRECVHRPHTGRTSRPHFCRLPTSCFLPARSLCQNFKQGALIRTQNLAAREFRLRCPATMGHSPTRRSSRIIPKISTQVPTLRKFAGGVSSHNQALWWYGVVWYASRSWRFSRRRIAAFGSMELGTWAFRILPSVSVSHVHASSCHLGFGWLVVQCGGVGLLDVAFHSPDNCLLWRSDHRGESRILPPFI